MQDGESADGAIVESRNVTEWRSVKPQKSYVSPAGKNHTRRVPRVGRRREGFGVRPWARIGFGFQRIGEIKGRYPYYSFTFFGCAQLSCAREYVSTRDTRLISLLSF